MKRRAFSTVVLAAAAALAAGCDPAKAPRPETAEQQRAQPRPVGPWLRPVPGQAAEPVWGVKDGLAVGLWPANGPRGLIRVYAPYLGQRFPRMVNYLSVEPVVDGVRGQSELEVGGRSGQRGLAMATGDTPEAAADPRAPTDPAQGRVERKGGVETLTFYLATEPFRNEARPVLQVILRADRPREVGFRVHAAAGSAPMDACVLSATMGNYGRLRRLWLHGEVADARRVWPEFRPDWLGFAPWWAWGRERLLRRGGEILVAATSDETDPARAAYDADVPSHWRYEGRPATHYWRTTDAAEAVVRVNGRATYWGGVGRIPGGVAYENFELQVPFADGQVFWFGVTPEGPEALGFDPAWGKNVTDGR